MVLHTALCILPTCPDARVNTKLCHAGPVVGTVRADHTIGPTIGRSAEVAWQTGAGRATVHLLTLRVRSAWAREAPLLRFILCKKTTIVGNTVRELSDKKTTTTYKYIYLCEL